MRFVYIILSHNFQGVYFYFYYYQYTSKSFKDFIAIEIKNEEPKKEIKEKKKEIKKVIEKKNNNENIEKLLIEERDKNKILNDKIKDLVNIIIKLKEENLDMKKKFEDVYNNLNEKLNNLEKEIKEKNLEIQNYILMIKKIKESRNEISSFVPGKEEILSVLFMTQGNQDIINYSMACKNTDLFVRLEERLYEDYPKYKNYETLFLVNTRKILRFKTLEENKIKNNDIISLFFNEE